MNERIEKLAAQAKFMAEEDINKQISYNAELKAFAEKFAELIVRECVKTVARQELMNHPEYNWPDRQIGYNEGIRVAMKKIKEHFGIES